MNILDISTYFENLKIKESGLENKISASQFFTIIRMWWKRIIKSKLIKTESFWFGIDTISNPAEWVSQLSQFRYSALSSQWSMTQLAGKRPKPSRHSPFVLKKNGKS